MDGALSSTIGSETVESRDAEEPIVASGLFGPVEQASFPFVQRLGREELLDLVRSRSYCAVMTPEEREQVLGAGRPALRRRTPAPGGSTFRT